MSYPESVNLPFNSEIIRDGFIPIRPGGALPPEKGLWLPLQANSMVVANDGEAFSLITGGRPDWLESSRPPVCIGTWHGSPLWTQFISRDVEIPGGFSAEPFNATEDRLDDRLLTLGGMAHQILHWQRNSRFCSRCGADLEVIEQTWGKACRSCRSEHFPHIHPCVIVLVKRDEEFLLARKGTWPVGRYGLIAGFLDFGESLEECVHREVREETGISVRNLRYVGSQNWPFPSQLMAGFVAEYAGGEVAADRDELEDARWFCAETLPPSLPPRRSIARWIIDRYALGNGLFTE